MSGLEVSQSSRDHRADVVASFARFRDTSAMMNVFQGLSDFAEMPIHTCDLVSSKQRLKPDAPHKTSLLVCYRLEFENGSDETLYLKAFLAGQVPVALREATATTHLPELNAVLWYFPDDPSLPQLKQLLNEETVKELLPFEKLPGFPADSISNVTAEVIRYKPEDRCICRYHISSDNSMTLFSKTFKDKRGEAFHENQLHLWQWSCEEGVLFKVAKPLGYHKATKTLWQTALLGRPALETSDHIADKTFLETVATGLAQLHSSHLVSSKTRTLQECLSEAREMCQTLEQHLPHLSPLLQTLLEKLGGKAPQFSSPHPIHSAFRLKQLLLEGEDVSVVDFDGFAMGDPCEDLTDFMADLHTYLPAATTKKAQRTFLESYRTHVSWTLAPPSLNWHSALKWLERATWLRYGLDVEEKRTAATNKIQRILERASQTLAWLALVLQNVFREMPYELI